MSDSNRGSGIFMVPEWVISTVKRRCVTGLKGVNYA